MLTKRSVPALAAGLLLAACVRTPPPLVVTAPAATPATVVVQQGTAETIIYPPAEHRDSVVRVSRNDVTRRAVDVFGDSVAPTPVATDPAADAPSWDIDVRSYENTDRVEHYVQLFTGTAKERIEERLSRGTRFEPMIRRKLREGDLPEDMYYLALIESGFDPNAYSRAAAVGMWQFMTSTGRDMGLRVDWWIDERRDPVKSTGAAVRFIKGLNEQFGSLYLAAAAYNGGPGRIARGLSRYADDLEGTTGDDLFFALAEKDYLKNETREYVPQLIAAALVAKEPDRYGMHITVQPPFAYDSVRVGPWTPLPAVAHAAGASVADLQELNPQVLRGITPPKDSVFMRVPVGAADTFALAYAALPKTERAGFHTVTSKKGQSLATIARREGLSTRQLALYNPKLRVLRSGNLAAGQSVMVPTEAVVAAAAPVPDPDIERYSSTAATTTHVVRSGETLSGIAKKYHTTTASLMKANGLRRALIFPGQTLVVNGSAPAAKATPKPKASTKKPAAKKKAAASTKKAAASSKTKSSKKSGASVHPRGR